jgi:hypothetical protein
MLADTDAIRALGAAGYTQAGDLSAAAATLLSVPGPAAAAVFGPVAARFLTALADAAANESDAVAALSSRFASTQPAATATAAAYDDTDHRAGVLLTVPTHGAGA